MKFILILTLSVASALAQSPLVRILNTTHPSATDFHVGDQFELLITGAPKQSISVRTTRYGRTDWGPVTAFTDQTGRWSRSGRFEANDYGNWDEIWTVGGKLASPAIHFLVGAPCLTGGQGAARMSGPNTIMICETAEGRQTFRTPSLADSFPAPDGRVIPGQVQANMTPDEYHMDILQHLITGDGRDIDPARVSLQSSSGGLGDEVADLISRLIGVNALADDEYRNALAAIRGAFNRPETIAPSARTPAKTLLFLQHLADSVDQDSLKKQIAETIAYVQRT